MSIVSAAILAWLAAAPLTLRAQPPVRTLMPMLDEAVRAELATGAFLDNGGFLVAGWNNLAEGLDEPFEIREGVEVPVGHYRFNPGRTAGSASGSPAADRLRPARSRC